MPYRFSRDVEISAEYGAVYGGLAGALVMLANLVAPAAGGVLAVPFFAIIMWAVFRDVWVIVSWGLLVAVVPLLFILFAFGGEASPGGHLLGLLLVIVALSLPWIFDGGPGLFLVYTFGGLFLAVIFGSLIVAVFPFEFGYTEIFRDTEVIDLYLDVDVSGIAMLGFMGFPAFGACYGAGLTLLYDDTGGDR